MADMGQAFLRRSNLSAVLRRLRRDGPQSRADIAADIALNKATVSSLVAELIDRGLVKESGPRPVASVGRPAVLLELDGAGVGAVGLEINVDYLAARATDFGGHELFARRIGFDARSTGVSATVDALARLGAEAVTAADEAGAAPAGVVVAVPGLVDRDADILSVAPNLGWSDVPLADRLRSGLRLRCPIKVENGANLATLAEFWSGVHGPVADLAYVSGEFGVGGGVIVSGALLRGADGYAGEVGHMLVDPRGERCGCGRIGCWETKVGLGRLLATAGVDADLAHGLDDPLAVVVRRAHQDDRRARSAFDEVSRWLAVGAAMLVDVFNPRVLVLGGYFARASALVVPAVQRGVEELSLAGARSGCRVRVSGLGVGAAVQGAVGAVIDDVMNDPVSLAPARPHKNSA